MNTSKTQVMAILNVTPDSFSDGGALASPNAILQAAEAALMAGADILDVGGESTRPGALPVAEDEELSRVIPAIEAIHQAFPEAFISVDTRKSTVAQAAIQAGAQMINDVSGLQWDPAMATVAAQTGAYLVIMHSQGTPLTMQQQPTYTDVVAEVQAFLQAQAQQAEAAGVASHRIWLDPGFGFGKTLAHNVALLRQLDTLCTLGYPVLVGTSRKSFLTGGNNIPPQDREALTAASLVLALEKGAQGVRVHHPGVQVPVVRWWDQFMKRDG